MTDDIHSQVAVQLAQRMELMLIMEQAGMLMRLAPSQQYFREKRQRRELRQQKKRFVNWKAMVYDIRTAAKRPRALPLHNLGEQSHGCGIVNRSLDALAFPEILKPAT